MNPIKMMLRLAMYPLVLGLSFMYMGSVQAVVIEGTTPSGKFKTVGLDNEGHLLVAIGTGTVVSHVITDTGSVTNATIVGSVEVKGNSTAVPVPVSGALGGPINVTGSVTGTFSAAASTAATVTTSQPSFGPGESTALAADPLRKQSVICNNDPSVTAYLGPAGVTTGSGMALGAGGCMSPDVPASFTGQINAISTAATTGKLGVMEFK